MGETDWGTRYQIANIRWIIEKAKDFQKSTYFWFFDYAKAFDCVDHNKLWKILKEIGIPDHLTSLLRNLYQFKKQQLELDMEQWTGSKSEKEYVQAVYCHPASLTFIKRFFSSSSLSAIRVVICISEVNDISPRKFDSSLCFIQPGILRDVLCI